MTGFRCAQPILRAATRLRPSRISERICSTVAFPVCLPRPLMSAIASSISRCRRWARDNSRDRAAMPGDDDGLAALDLVEQFGEVGFGLGHLNFSGQYGVSISPFDW